MKFKSRKDDLFYGFTYGSVLFLLIMAIIEFKQNGLQHYEIITYLLIVLSIGLLLWVFHGTNYELTPQYLKYQSGPTKGTIEIATITTIINGKTMWSGMKPATAKKGLIIKYNRFEEIYISPENNEIFLQEILKFNNKIEVQNP
jgi:hypothetical protein